MFNCVCSAFMKLKFYMLASGCQMNRTFISHSVKPFIYLFPFLSFWHECAISLHWSPFLYEWPNEAREPKEEICPSETSLNQCDVFTPNLRWACRPNFSAMAAQTAVPPQRGRQSFWTVNTLNTHANKVEICIQATQWLTPLQPALGWVRERSG